MAIKFYHEQFLGLSVPMSNPLIRPVRQGIKSAYAEMGSQQKHEKPVDVGDTDGDAGERSGMRGRREGVMYSSGGVVFCSCCERRNCLPRETEFSMKYTVWGGGMWR